MNSSVANSISAEDRSGEYHAVSGWAIAAFVLGILSVTALAAPVLWSVPIAAAACAVVAMFHINRSRGGIIGWNIALLGLVLAVMFGVAAPARALTRWIWLEKRAEIFAAEFIRLLQENQPYAAHQFAVPAAARQKSLAAAPEIYAANKVLSERYDTFLKTEPVKSLLSEGSKAKVDLISSVLLPAREGADNIGLRYRISYPEDGGMRSFEADLVLEHSIERQTQGEQWIILRTDKVGESTE